MFTPGPGNWVTPSELFHLQDRLGFHRAFKSISITSLAARNRVAHVERVQPHVGVQSLLLALASAENRVADWGEWYSQSFQHTLSDAVDQMEAAGSSAPLLSASILATCRVAPSDPSGFVRKRFQAAAYKLFLDKEGRSAQQMVRKNYGRWKDKLRVCPGSHHLPDRHAADHFCSNLFRLHSLAPPRVCASVFNTFWNRWCTARRFQQEGRCIFGCGSVGAQDSVEHYAYCSSLRGFALNTLHVEASHVGVLDCFLLTRGGLSDDQLGRLALLVHCAYTLHNHNRHLPPLSSPPSPLPFLRRTAHLTTLGSPLARLLSRAQRPRRGEQGAMNSSA